MARFSSTLVLIALALFMVAHIGEATQSAKVINEGHKGPHPGEEQTLKEKVVAAEQRIVEKAKQLKDSVVSTEQSVVQKAKETIHQVKEKVVAAEQNVAQKVEEIKEKVVNAEQNLAQKAANVGQKLKEQTGQTIQNVKAKVVELKERVINTEQNLQNQASEKIQATKEKITQAEEKFINILVARFGQAQALVEEKTAILLAKTAPARAYVSSYLSQAASVIKERLIIPVNAVTKNWGVDIIDLWEQKPHYIFLFFFSGFFLCLGITNHSCCCSSSSSVQSNGQSAPASPAVYSEGARGRDRESTPRRRRSILSRSRTPTRTNLRLKE